MSHSWTHSRESKRIEEENDEDDQVHPLLLHLRVQVPKMIHQNEKEADVIPAAALEVELLNESLGIDAEAVRELQSENQLVMTEKNHVISQNRPEIDQNRRKNDKGRKATRI
jgi:hypothetical protein